MKVQVEKADAYFYPDVMVTRNPKDLANNLYKQHPLFIAEVLSPSTEAFDRGNKFNSYRQLDSLQTYWLIDTNAILAPKTMIGYCTATLKRMKWLR